MEWAVVVAWDLPGGPTGYHAEPTTGRKRTGPADFGDTENFRQVGIFSIDAGNVAGGRAAHLYNPQ
jgi:hypothetical protein